MVEVVNDLRRLSLLVLLLPLIPRTTAHAHRLDEYLLATLVEIEPDQVRLEINLTPGVQVTDQVLAAIDTDHDGVISPGEAAAYADVLKRDLIVRMDERKVELTTLASKFPEALELRDGWGIIQIAYGISAGSLKNGKHKLTFQNRHMSGIGVYIVNAAQPKSDAIAIVAQRRNPNQSDSEIDFTVKGAKGSSDVAGLAGLLGVGLIIAVAALWPKVTRKTPSPAA